MWKQLLFLNEILVNYQQNDIVCGGWQVATVGA